MEAINLNDSKLIQNDPLKLSPGDGTGGIGVGTGVGVGILLDKPHKSSSGKKKIKRKKVLEKGEPKMPLTGYVRFMNERRDKLRIEYPSKTAIDHTKIIGEEWNSMSDVAKAPYLNAYLEEKIKYNKEYYEFMETKKSCENGQENDDNLLLLEDTKQQTPNTTCGSVDNKQQILEKVQQMNGGSSRNENTNTICTYAQNNNNLLPLNFLKSNNRSHPGENGIPIFTDEFLEHNKTVDFELRTLRKSNIDYEQQNSALEKHVENMKFGVEKVENENAELEEKNLLLRTYLEKLKLKLAQALSGLALPSEPQGATIENIEKYMHDLYGMVTSNSHGPASLNKAKDIIRKLDLNIQL